MERQEYTAETYPSFGKKYNGEKAIISLTSWKARINTVAKTIYSLIKQCPGFHIVLVLSEEEFPKMMNELPENLMLFAENELIEVLWVYKNYKSFKKVLFTMDKYKTVPVISADDDCIYTYNYAQDLYNKWEKNENSIITFGKLEGFGFKWCRGPATLYRPNCFLSYAINNLKNVNNFINDDAYISAIIKKLSIDIVSINKRFENFTVFHDTINPLSSIQYNIKKDITDYLNCLI